VACFANGLEHLMDQLWFWLHPFDPAQHGGWAMAPVLPFFVRHVLLEIVIGHPFVMGCQQILPSVRFLKAPVGHAPLNAKRRFSIILIGPSFFDFLAWESLEVGQGMSSHSTQVRPPTDVPQHVYAIALKKHTYVLDVRNAARTLRSAKR